MRSTNSDVLMENASRTVGNATGTWVALMEATNQQLSVGQTVRTWKVAGLPATMGNASRAVGNATGMGSRIALMAATRLKKHVPETAPRDTSNATVANASGAV